MRSSIAAHLRANHVEVLVTLEATDPLTGNPFMARHSYTAEQIVWDHGFVPDLLKRGSDGVARIDWDLFHALRPVAFNEEMPRVEVRG